jgi:dienelactone hydrolase
MRKFSLIALLFSIVLNAHAFLVDDKIVVNDSRLNEKVNLSITKFTKGDPAPTIIVLHGCDGAKPHYNRWARIVNAWGYNAVLPDSFGPRNVNNHCLRKEDVIVQQRNEDIAAVANWIVKQKWHKGKIGVIGFSNGGSAILQASNHLLTDKISAMVAYYPWCGEGDYNNPKIPVQIHIGMRDRWTPASRCEPFKDAYNYNTYETATHSFEINAPPRDYTSRWGPQRLEYDPVSANLAEKRSKEFFAKFLGTE